MHDDAHGLLLPGLTLLCLLNPFWEEQEENERIEAYARMKRQQEEKLAAEKDCLPGPCASASLTWTH